MGRAMLSEVAATEKKADLSEYSIWVEFLWKSFPVYILVAAKWRDETLSKASIAFLAWMRLEGLAV